MRRFFKMAFFIRFGALAHLVERNVRNVKVRGSSPLCSTKLKHMKKSALIVSLAALLLQSCGVVRIVTVEPQPVVVTQTVSQPVVAQTRQVVTTTTNPRNHTTTTTTVQVNALTQDVCLYLDLQAVGAAFAQSNSVQQFEQILNSNAYMISNLDLNRDGYIDYLRVLETVQGYNHVLLIQAVLAANVYQDVATIVAEMGYATPYVQVIGAPYIYGANYIIEPVFYARPPMFDVWGRPHYTYWRSPYYWDYWPAYYTHHAPYELGHYHAYVETYMHNHHYCHTVHYVEHHHYVHYEDLTRNDSRHDYADQHPEQSFSRRTTATYVPEGQTQPTRVTNAQQLRQAVRQSGAATSTTTSTRQTSSNRQTTATQQNTTTSTRQTSTTTRQTATSTAQQPTSTRQASTTTNTTTRQATNTTTTTTTTQQPATTRQTSGSSSTRSQKQAESRTTTTSRVKSSGQATTTRTPARTSSSGNTNTSTRSTGTSTRSTGTSTRSTGTSTRSTGTSTRSTEGNNRR